MIDPPPHYTTSPRISHLVTAAYGTKTNSRNIENPNYAPYKDSLSDLVDFPVPDGSLAAQQQYNIWLTKETLDLHGLSRRAADAAYTDGYSDAEQTPPREPRRSKRLVVLNPNPTTQGQVAKKVPTKRKKAEPDPESTAVQKALEAYNAFQNEPAPPTPRFNFLLPADGHGQPAQDINEGSEQSNPNPHGSEQPAHGDGDHSQHLNADEAEEDEYADADVSMSSVATVPNKRGKDNFPDVVVSHTCVRKMDEPTHADARFAWEARLGQKVTHQCFPVIVELKRAPSRPLRGNVFTAELARFLVSAEAELCYYVAIQLERDPHAPSVIAISGSGGWWRWAEFKRAEAAPLEFWAAQKDNKSLPQDLLHLYTTMTNKFLEQPIRHLGTADSDDELNALRQNALIPILEAHSTCYTTAAVPPAQTTPTTAQNPPVSRVGREFVVGSSRAQAPRTAQNSPVSRGVSKFVVGSSSSAVRRVTRRRG
ncbi:hypothetical protein C8Q74DRAFT_1243143 [Fomes fomentarius]|nr:hypothetical protein C8Q74DRAFT_1243143 [Fomes fomentarius]